MPDVRRPGTTTPLVGRVAELAALTAALERAAAGRAGLVLLAGDAGVGKTRLVDELGARAADAGALVLVGRCLEAGASGLPYLPFVEALHGLGAAGEDGALRAHPALARILPALPVPEPPPDDGLGRLPLFDAVHALLAGLAAERPVLLVLEDLHWADRSTRDLLSFLAARLRAERLLLVGTYRSDDLHRRHPLRPALAELARLAVTERVPVAPFDGPDADRFVRAVADGPIDDAAVRSVVARSEGNAFLAEELLAAGAAGAALPPDLADVLLARFEQLPAEVQHVVRVAAVGGRRVWHERLARVAAVGEDELEAALRVAVERSVLAPDPSGVGYAFRHALTQEAVYSDLLPGQRTRLHAAYARVLAGGTGPGAAAELAHHALAGGDAPVALTACVVAAEEAARSGAPTEVLRHLEQALELWSAVPEPAAVAGARERDLMLRASTAASAAGDPERALAHARAAAATVDASTAPDEAAAVAQVLARQLLALELCDEACAVTAAALARWGDQPDEPGWVRLLATSAGALYYSRRLDEAERTARRAVAAARALGLRDTEADAVLGFGLVAARTGRADEGMVLLDRAARLAGGAGAITTALQALFHLGLTRFEHDRAAEGLVTLDEGVRLAEGAGLTWSTYGLELRVMQVLVRAVLGDWDGAERAARTTTAVVSRLVEARVAAAAMWVVTGRGRFDEAEELLARVRPYTAADSQIAVLVGLTAIELHLWRDEPAAAADAARRALERLAADEDGLPFATVRLCALALTACAALPGTAAAADGLHARVRVVMEAERPGGRRPGPEALAWALVADAEHGRVHGRDDAEVWARAADLFAFGAVYERARCRWREAAARLAEGDRDAAAGPLREAAEVAERLGARPLADAVARLAARAGLAPRPAAPALLTPREQAVLDLVAGGRTNRQVGAELFISEKTVSVHLSRVMAKLGAGSRTEAVALAAGRGLLGRPEPARPPVR